MTSDPALIAAYRRAFARRGVAVPVTVTRLNGAAPNVVPFSADILAIVRDYTPDGMVVQQAGFAIGKPGAITQGDRMVIVMAADLAAKNFPLPLKKNDRITLKATSDVLNVVDVDANKRAAAGAIELKAAGVA